LRGGGSVAYQNRRGLGMAAAMLHQQAAMGHFGDDEPERQEHFS
jgi:hypothetical protein